MLVVVALGGNALLRQGEPVDARTQEANVRLATRAIAAIATEHRVVITHGNGPQIGLLALQNAAYDSSDPYPLDILGAETEGMVGYLIEREMRNALPDHPMATLLTQVEVDARDPAFERPTKPIGPRYAPEAAASARERGWTLRSDDQGSTRVVASPEPLRILEMRAIRTLVEAGSLVICAGGGGIPVVANEDGDWSGVEAVIDKDLTAAMLARDLEADALLLLTDVEGIYESWGTDQARALRHLKVSDLQRLDLAAGSMAPKAEAARRAVQWGVRYVAIGCLEQASEMLEWKSGTIVTAD